MYLKKSTTLTLILLVIFCLSCSSKPAIAPAVEKIDSATLLNKVTLGMTREIVEGLLGKPYSVKETYSKDPKYSGVEISALYSPKLRSLEQQIADDMRGNQNIHTTTSILGGTLSIIGSIIPGASIATSASNSAVGVAGDLAANPIDLNSMDPNKIESAEVVYREDKVISIVRRNLASGPR